jgi:hypothetical protein
VRSAGIYALSIARLRGVGPKIVIRSWAGSTGYADIACRLHLTTITRPTITELETRILITCLLSSQ